LRGQFATAIRLPAYPPNPAEGALGSTESSGGLPLTRRVLLIEPERATAVGSIPIVISARRLLQINAFRGNVGARHLAGMAHPGRAEFWPPEPEARLGGTFLETILKDIPDKSIQHRHAAEFRCGSQAVM
jgi:hypothetical protein